MASTLRELAVRVTADSTSYQREMSRASRLGTDYYKAMEERSRRFDSYIASNNNSIQAMNAQLTQIKASALSLSTAFAGGFAFTSIIGTADDWGQMSARIRMAITAVEGSADSYDAVQSRLLDMSNRNAKAIGDSQELYVSTASSMRDLGYSTSETLDFIESMSNSYTINATSADKVKTSIDAITKSLVTGKVGADQWKQIMASTPNIVTEIANATGKSEVVIKQLGLSGQISMRQLADAAIQAKDRTSALADGMGNTVKDGFTQILNSFQSFIGELNNSKGATQSVASGLKVVADNIDLISIAAGGLVTVGLSRYFGNLSTSIYDATKQKLANNAALIDNAKKQRDAMIIAQQAIAEEKRRLVIQKENIVMAQAQSNSLRAQTSLNAQLIAVETQLDNVKRKEIATTNSLAAANAKLSVAKRAASGLLGLIGGPVGLATTLLAVGAGFLAMSDGADKAKKPIEELQLPVNELLKKYKELGKAQQQVITSGLDAEVKVNVKATDVDLKELKSKLRKEFEEIIISMDGTTAIPNVNAKDGQEIDRFIEKVSNLRDALKDGKIKVSDFDQGVYDAESALKAATGRGDEFDSTLGGLIANLMQNSRQLAENREKLDAVTLASAEAAAGAKGLKDVLTFPNLDNQLGSLNQQLEIAKIKTEAGGEAAYVLAGLQKAAGDEASNHATALYALALGQETAGISSDELATKLKAYVGVLRETYKLNQSPATPAVKHGKSTVDIYKSQLDKLNSQINAFTDINELQKIKRQLAEGELSKLNDVQKKTLEIKAAEIDRLNAQKEYKSILDSLRSPAEQQLDTYKEQLSIIEKANLSLKEREDLLNKMAKKSMESAPSFSFKDSYNGIGSDLINVAEEDKKLQDWNNQQLKMQQDLLNQKLISQQEYADSVVQIEQTMQEKQKSLQSAYTLASLGTFSTLTGSIADMFKDTAGESSAAYKAMFLASKAAAIAQSIVSTEVAANEALKYGGGGAAGIAMSNIIRGIGYASVGVITAQTISGMAHSGIDNIPKEGTWLLDRGERVVDARTNADLKNFLQTSNKSSGNLTVNVPVNIEGGASEEDGKKLGNLIKASVFEILRDQKRNGGIVNNR